MTRRIKGAPVDVITVAERIARCRAALATLAHRDATPPDTEVAAWEADQQRTTVLLAADGNIIRRAADQAWTPLDDPRSAAVAANLEFLASPAKPIVIEGADPPYLLQRVSAGTPRLADGYAPRIIVLEPSWQRLLDAIATGLIDDAIADPRCTILAGPDAHAALYRDLARRIDLALPAHYLRSPGAPRTESPAPSIIRAALQRQQVTHEQLLRAVRARDDTMSTADWAARFRAAIDGADEPFRILIPISRFSTYVRHSAADLADALERLGHRARILTEPDDHSRLASPAYLRAFDEFRPDLIVLINYTRAHMRDAVPRGVPFVCWVQDRMPHLFDERIGRAQGERDFLVGHPHERLDDLFGYPRRQMMPAFVPTSPRTFHRGPISPDLLADFACDIAYISHQSEPPRDAHERIAGGFRDNPGIQAAMGLCYEALVDAERTGTPIPSHRGMILEILARVGIRDPDERMVHAFQANYFAPIRERLRRHAALGWAADIADRHSLDLRLYGNGWERHPRLASYARGPIDHDDAALIAAYRAAAVHLHISAATNAHQRVAECALSGGLMLRRGPSPDHWLMKVALNKVCIETLTPAAKHPDGRWEYELHAGREPDPIRYRDHIGKPLPPDPEGTCDWRRTINGAPILADHFRDDPVVPPLTAFPDYTFPSASETCFETPDDLEAMILRARDDHDWRAATIDAHEAAARQHMTVDTLARDLLGFVTRRLNAPAG